MRKTVLLLSALLLGAAPVCADDFTRLRVPTGLEWLQSSGIEREDQLLATLYSVKQAGIPMKERFLTYADGVYRQLMRHPELQPKPLTDALAAYLYETDPATRPLLDKLRTP